MTFSINERVSGQSNSRFGPIPNGNIKFVVSRKWKAQVPFVSYLSIFDSARTSVIEPGLFSMKSRESMRNVSLHPRNYHLRNALDTHREISDLEAVVIPQEIGKVNPVAFQPS